MVIYFKEINGELIELPFIDGAKEATQCGGNFIVIDMYNHVSDTNGIPAKSLGGWNRAIGFERTEDCPMVTIGGYQFMWCDTFWRLLFLPSDIGLPVVNHTIKLK